MATRLCCRDVLTGSQERRGPWGTGTVLLARARPPPRQPGGSQRRDPGGLAEPGPPWATWSTNAATNQHVPECPCSCSSPCRRRTPTLRGATANRTPEPPHPATGLQVRTLPRRGSAPPAALVPCPPGVATQRRSTAAAEAGGASPWPRAPALSRPWRAVEPQARQARRLAALARELWEQDVAPCTHVPGSGPRCCSHPALQDPACHRGAQSRLCLRAPEAAARNLRWLRGA